MPIHLKILNPRLAEAGKIKIGHLGEEREKKGRPGETYQLPVKLDHFIITKTERGKGKDKNFELDHELMSQIPKDEDGKIREISILLSSDDIEEVFPTTLACYNGRNLFCRGDGNAPATRYEIVDKKRTGRWKKHDCPCDLLTAEQGLQCKPHGTFWVTVMAGEHTQIGARHSFRTTSWDSIRSILAGLQEIQRMVGTLVGPQLRMKIRPRVVKPKGQDRSKTVYVVHVSLIAKDIQELRERVLAQAQMRHSVATLAGRPIRLGLPAPGVAEGPAEQSRLQQEFHPDPAPDEDDEADDEADFDPVTGEVFDTGSGDWQSDPKPEEESQDVPPVEEQQLLADDHPTRIEAKRLLNEIAFARDFSEEDMGKGRAFIWREACAKAEYEGLPWAALNLHRWKRIGPALQELLKHHDEEI